MLSKLSNFSIIYLVAEIKAYCIFKGDLLMKMKTLSVLAMAAVMSCGLSCGAYAKNMRTSINVTYMGIKIVVDGNETVPRDSRGREVEPFLYDGTIYLPVRAAVNAITGGTKNVEWDAEEAAIYIGSRPSAPVSEAPASVSLAAAQTEKTLNVTYKDIKIVVDGEKVIPRDSNGDEVEPFIADGTTYLPVRAAVDAITGGQKAVEWDAETATMYIGSRNANTKVDLSTLRAYNGKPAVKNEQVYSFKVNGTLIEPVNYLPESGSFELNGEYSRLVGYAACADTTPYETREIIFRDVDKDMTLGKAQPRLGSEPVEITVDVKGVKKLNIKKDSEYKLYNLYLIPAK